MQTETSKEIINAIDKALSNKKKQLDFILKEKGINFLELKKEKERKKEQDKQNILNKERKDKQDKQDLINAIKGLKFEPIIEVTVPKIELPKIEIPTINVPEIKLPTINIPKITIPEAKIKVEIPKQEPLKDIEVKGLKEFKDELIKLLKEERLSDINRDNPLPVILTDEKGILYRASMAITAGGGGGMSGELLGETAGTLKQRISYITGTSNIEYVGEAQSDTKTTDLKWRIKKLIYDGSNNLLEINWCNSEIGFKFSWDLKATYSYY